MNNTPPPNVPGLSITDDQRTQFRQWAAALSALDETDKLAEAEAWIVSALSILTPRLPA